MRGWLIVAKEAGGHLLLPLFLVGSLINCPQICPASKQTLDKVVDTTKVTAYPAHRHPIHMPRQFATLSYDRRVALSACDALAI